MVGTKSTNRGRNNAKMTTKTKLTSPLPIPQQNTDKILKSVIQKPASRSPSDSPYKLYPGASQYRIARAKLDSSRIRRSPRLGALNPAQAEDAQPTETDETYDTALKVVGPTGTNDSQLTGANDTEPTGPVAAHPTETEDAHPFESADAHDTEIGVISTTFDELNALKKELQRAQEKCRRTKDKCRKLKEQHRRMAKRHQRTKKQRQSRRVQENRRKKKHQKIRELYQHAKQGHRDMEAITADTLHKYEYLAAHHGDWGCMSDQKYEEAFFRMFLSLKHWAENHAYEEPRSWKAFQRATSKTSSKAWMATALKST